MIVRLSVLRKTIFNPEYEVSMCSLMYVLTTFNSKLSVANRACYLGLCRVWFHANPLALVFHSLCFLSVSQILFATNCVAPLLIRQRHFVRPYAAFFQCSVSFGHLVSTFLPKFSLENFNWQSLIRHSCNMASPSSLCKLQ